MSESNSERFEPIAIVGPENQAFRIKSQLLKRGHRQVDVFTSEALLEHAREQGYDPAQIID